MQAGSSNQCFPRCPLPARCLFLARCCSVPACRMRRTPDIRRAGGRCGAGSQRGKPSRRVRSIHLGTEVMDFVEVGLDRSRGSTGVQRAVGLRGPTWAIPVKFGDSGGMDAWNGWGLRQSTCGLSECNLP